MRKPYTVLFDAQRLFTQKSGVEYYTIGLIQHLAKVNPARLVLVGYYSGRRPPSGSVPESPAIRYKRTWVPLKAINLLRRIGVPLPIELLVGMRAGFMLFPNFLGLPSLFKTPSAAVIHDLTFVDLPEYVSRRNLHDLRRFVPTQIKRSSFVITVSEFSKRRITDEFGIASDDILVTPIPPAKTLDLSQDKQRAILEDLGIAGEYLLTLGTVEPRKNLLNMLAAYDQLPAALQSKYTFVVAGKIGWNCEAEQARLAELQQKGANVVQLGYVTDEQRAALYGGAALFTSASHYEGFGMPVLEAMSYGTACALSDIPVFREVAGEAALYFDQQNPTSIADAWTELLTNQTRRQRLNERGRSQAVSYSWDKVAASVYDRIMLALEKETHG